MKRAREFSELPAHVRVGGRWVRVKYSDQLPAEDGRIRAAALNAGRLARERAVARGVPYVIGRDGKVIRVSPDMTETVIGEY
ncbi:MAG: hypothetical protein IJR99_12240 [Kiritimatiellae bacterium]|nr:hypothetical protein [Kiritimatiellia bacterium]